MLLFPHFLILPIRSSHHLHLLEITSPSRATATTRTTTTTATTATAATTTTATTKTTTATTTTFPRGFRSIAFHPRGLVWFHSNQFLSGAVSGRFCLGLVLESFCPQNITLQWIFKFSVLPNMTTCFPSHLLYYTERGHGSDFIIFFLQAGIDHTQTLSSIAPSYQLMLKKKIIWTKLGLNLGPLSPQVTIAYCHHLFLVSLEAWWQLLNKL